MINDTSKSIVCRIETDNGLISMREFSYFQYHFVAAYSLAYELISKNNIKSINDLINLPIDTLQNLMFRKKNISFYARTLDIPKEFDIYLLDIHRENPIINTFVASIIVLTLAVVFSGGKIEITRDGVKAELPPLGVGIQSIKDAFDNNLQNIDFKRQINEEKN